MEFKAYYHDLSKVVVRHMHRVGKAGEMNSGASVYVGRGKPGFAEGSGGRW